MANGNLGFPRNTLIPPQRGGSGRGWAKGRLAGLMPMNWSLFATITTWPPSTYSISGGVITADGRILVALTTSQFGVVHIWGYSGGVWTDYGAPSGTYWGATANCRIAVLPDGRIFAMDCATASGRTFTECAIFDPATNAWTACASMPIPRGAQAILAFMDRIVVIGGTDTAGSYTNTVYIYTIATNSWAANPNNYPYNTSNASTGILPSGDGLVTGGNCNSGSYYTNDTYRYSVANGTFTQLAYAPAVLVHSQANIAVTTPEGCLIAGNGSYPYVQNGTPQPTGFLSGLSTTISGNGQSELALSYNESSNTWTIPAYHPQTYGCYYHFKNLKDGSLVTTSTSHSALYGLQPASLTVKMTADYD